MDAFDPFSFQDEDDEDKGFDVDDISAILNGRKSGKPAGSTTAGTVTTASSSTSRLSKQSINEDNHNNLMMMAADTQSVMSGDSSTVFTEKMTSVKMPSVSGVSKASRSSRSSRAGRYSEPIQMNMSSGGPSVSGTDSAGSSRHQGKKVMALPPRFNVRLALQEEVSSMAVPGSSDNGKGSGGVSLSQLFIEGKVVAQVLSSNAKKNIPFLLKISGHMATTANIKCNDYCILQEETQKEIICRVDIPKSKALGMEILNYSINIKTQNMPILVQTKSSIVNNICRIGIQIRSNLSNKGPLETFSIVVAIPHSLKGSTLKITRGENGAYDQLKRIVTWKIPNLPQGNSCLVSAEAELISSLQHQSIHKSWSMLNGIGGASSPETTMLEEKLQFPVLVRCSSGADQISDLKLSAMTLENVPASITTQQTMAFRLLHRVGKSAG